MLHFYLYINSFSKYINFDIFVTRRDLILTVVVRGKMRNHKKVFIYSFYINLVSKYFYITIKNKINILHNREYNAQIILILKKIKLVLKKTMSARIKSKTHIYKTSFSSTCILLFSHNLNMQIIFIYDYK